MGSNNIVPFPKWSAAQLAQLVKDLDRFDALPRTHPEYDDDPHRSDRSFCLAMAVDSEHSRFFWPEDRNHQFDILCRRLGIFLR